MGHRPQFWSQKKLAESPLVACRMSARVTMVVSALSGTPATRLSHLDGPPPARIGQLVSRHISMDDDLQDGYETGGLGPQYGQSAKEPIEPPPRLCEAGPCRHYHRFIRQMDAQDPIAISAGASSPPDATQLEHGRVSLRVYHTEAQHYCFPEVGIETNLGSTPIVDCTHWDPRTKTELDQLADRRRMFQKSDRGKAFDAARKAWSDARDREDAAMNAALAKAEQDMAAMAAHTKTDDGDAR